jgi:FPC/CPF motif-containing protein YcgG
MVMLFQPRSVFGGDGVDAEIDDRTRSVIRERILAWDGMPHHSALGSYGDEDNREWKQYFLPDNDESQTGGCPLKRREGRRT